MNGGDIILADEPTGALDSKSGEDVVQILKDLNAQGHTIIMVTHDPGLAAQAERVIEIKDGYIIADYKNKHYFEYAGAAGGFIDKLGYPFCRGRLFDTIEKDIGQYNDTSQIFWASGACLFIRKSVFDALDGFDESYFAHMEEIDLCWRAHNSGCITKYVGTSTVYHVGGATLNSADPRKTYLNFRNSLYTLTKNAPKNLFLLVFTRLVLDGVAGLRFLTALKFKHTFAIVKSHLIFFSNIPQLLEKRKKLKQSLYVKNTSNYYHVKSIVWLYFAKNHKKFRE